MAKEKTTVILTHEHTDFDALASMLGANKLHPYAVPVLPRSLNRNLEGFLALYRSALPFRRQEELPKQHIEFAIVVDTQTYATIRGMKADTPGMIVDHHALHRTLDPGWTYWGGDTGATTTLLVEQICEQKIPVTAVEATLFLLGIHEDTGSMVYATTTSRDVRAAAWLMERGANMQVLARFLHHPLSAAQQELYAKLAENSETVTVAGHSVVIASAVAPDYQDEISTLAHTLRDIYDPAGLFLVVDLGDRIQLVARSTTDAIDVGAITKEMGGGGHTRAAAALIRRHTLPEVRARLLALLEQIVKPSLTVGQIMTHGTPIAVPPDMTIDGMTQVIQRYGFEGYPVVEGHNGRPIHAEQLRGLISRRQIDRAQHHGLASHTVDRYMRTGAITVTPDQSIADLQRVMIESGWGQIPVVDPASHQIIGIVTRTDLIKLWGQPIQESRREDIILRMDSALPASLLALLRLAGAAADDLGFPLYAVGGFVRDLLLGKPNFDVDLVVEGDGVAVAKTLAARYGGRIRSHKRFGTAKWILPPTGNTAAGAASTLATELGVTESAFLPASLDFVTARTEFYAEPTALPTVERSSIKLDLHRRDFTINTLAICLTPERWGELLDFYGGERDLQEHLIRVLHTHSFVDDPTRILRAVRFEQRFGFQIEARTVELIADSVDLLERITPARVRHELELIFAEPRPEQALRRLDRFGVTTYIHPELHSDDWVTSRFEALRASLPADRSHYPAQLDQLYFALWTYRLPASTIPELDLRLNLMRSTITLLENLQEAKRHVHELKRPDLKRSQICRILQPTSEATRLLLPIATASDVVLDYVMLYDQDLRFVRPLTDGRDLKKMGLPPGPLYRDVLDAARDGWLDGTISSKEEEKALVSQWVQGHLNQTKEVTAK